MSVCIGKWFCVGILLVGGSSLVKAGSQTDSLSRVTFEQALGITRQNSHVLKQYEFLHSQRKQELKAARGLYMPSVSLTASYVAMSDDITLDLNPVKDAITPLYEALGNYGNFSGVSVSDGSGGMITLSDDMSTAAVRGKLNEGLEEINAADWDQMIQKKQFGMISAGFSWALFTGGKISAANMVAQIRTREAEEIQEQKEGEILSELVERYYGSSLAYSVVRIREEVLQAMTNHLNDAQKMFDQGIIPKVQLLHAKVFESQADRELKKSKRQIEIVNEALSNTMSLGQGVQIAPVSKLFYVPSIQSLAYFKNMARNNSPLLKQINSKKDLAHQKYRLEKSAYYPSLAAMGTYDLANKDLSPYMPDYIVGLGLKWTLFDGMARTRKVKAAGYQQRQVDEIEGKANADIETIIEKCHHEVLMDIEQLEELDTALDFAKEYLQVRQKAFSEGISTSTELVDARLVLAKVKIERLETIYNYDVALARLLQYAGMHNDFVKYQLRADVEFESYSK